MDKIIQQLNSKYELLSPPERMKQIFKDYDPDRILITSSFGTTSAYLLYLLSKVRRQQKVYFIDTTYHFQETINYKNQLKQLLGLNIESLYPNKVDNEFTRNNKTWKTNPDFCCTINKVNPINDIKGNYDIWMSGLMRFQSTFRKERTLFEQNGVTKFYPILDVTINDLRQFAQFHKLPQHPLLLKGYESVGCTHCTKKGEGRTGRWNYSKKTECGLHNIYYDEHKEIRKIS